MAEEEGVKTVESSMKEKVMVAIDESEFSEHALQWTLENLASTISDFELVIYTAQTPVDISYLYASSWGIAEQIKNLKECQRKDALDLLKKAKDTCKKYGIVAEELTSVGDPKVAICRAVEKLNIQLLVLGNHGRGAITRLACTQSIGLFSLRFKIQLTFWHLDGNVVPFDSTFLGSVSNYCVHHAKCPVLVVRKTH